MKSLYGTCGSAWSRKVPSVKARSQALRSSMRRGENASSMLSPSPGPRHRNVLVFASSALKYSFASAAVEVP